MRRLRILSLGAGVQSTTVALMAAQGLIEPPDLALFADTGAEPAPVYEHLQWLMSGNVLPFPVHVIQKGDLRADLLAGVNSTGQSWVSIPFFGRTPAGTDMMARRQCTDEYKLKPIRAWVVRHYREAMGKSRPTAGYATMQIGISVDETWRMKPSRVRYIANEYPLLDLGMRRWDCELWLRRNGYPQPPKSACCECPFRRNAEWRWLQANDPHGFEAACVVDESLRAGGRAGRFDAALFLHRSMVPLREADIRHDDDKTGQSSMLGECLGMCGV